jgi:hypothetical protein
MARVSRKPRKDSAPECPVCGSTSVRLTTASNVFLSVPPVSLSYRCENGHVFLMPNPKADAAASGE